MKTFLASLVALTYSVGTGVPAFCDDLQLNSSSSQRVYVKTQSHRDTGGKRNDPFDSSRLLGVTKNTGVDKPVKPGEEQARIKELLNKLVTDQEQLDVRHLMMQDPHKNVAIRRNQQVRQREQNRIEAQQKLLKIGPRAIPFLIDSLNDPRPEIGRVTSAVLGLFGSKAIAPLVAAISSGKVKADKVSLAVLSLRNVGPDAIPALVQLVKSGTNEQQVAALNAISDLWWSLRREGTASMPSAAANPSPSKAPVKRNPPAELRGLVLAAMADKNTQKKDAGAFAASQIYPTDPKVVEQLIAGLSGSDDNFRQTCINAIGNAAKFQSTAQMTASAKGLSKLFFQDKRRQVRRTILDALGSFSNAPDVVIPIIKAALKDNDPGVRDSALRALSALGPAGSGALPELIKLVEKRSPETIFALSSIASMGPNGTPALPSMIKLSASTSSSNQADFGLRRQLAKNFRALGPAGAPAIPELVKMVNDQANIATQMEAMEALIAMGPAARAARPALEELGRKDSKMEQVVRHVLNKIP